jgi:hypothetical protein
VSVETTDPNLEVTSEMAESVPPVAVKNLREKIEPYGGRIKFIVPKHEEHPTEEKKAHCEYHKAPEKKMTKD